jgi:putative ABC transport system permease protein
MGIPLLRGRYLEERDGPDSAPVIDINQTMARTFWPNEDAVGKRVQFGPPGSNRPWYTIVGVVGDVHQMGLEVPARPEMYFPIAQNNPGGSFFWPRALVVRTTGDPVKVAADVRRAVAAVDRDQPAFGSRTMEDIVDTEVSHRHTQMILLAAFAVLALLLAAVGLYGLLAYTVAQRTPEIGLRMALGAERAKIVAGVVRRGLGLAAWGVCIGLLLSVAVTRAISSLLFHVGPRDPFTLAAGAVLLLAVAAAASFIPARRAASVDPVIALRHE